MLKMLLRSTGLVLLIGSVFSPLKAGRNEKVGEEKNAKVITKSLSSKKKEIEENDEKDLSLSNALNLGLHMNENTALPKGWNLVEASKNRDINKPLSFKKHPKRIELLGDNYTFYTNAPSLKNFDKTTFVFSANVRSTNPGVFIQYYDGKNAVSSTPYASKQGEWETLSIEFTVDANAKFHRLYSAILGSVKNNPNTSVDISSIQLQRKPLFKGLDYFSLLNSQSQKNAQIGQLNHLLSRNLHGQGQTVAVVEHGGSWNTLQEAISRPNGVLHNVVKSNYKSNFLSPISGQNRDPHSSNVKWDQKWWTQHGALTSSVVLDYAPQAKVLPVSTYLSAFDPLPFIHNSYDLADALIDLSKRKDVAVINISGSAVPNQVDTVLQGYNLDGTPKYGYKLVFPPKLADAFKMVAKSGKAIVIAAFNDGEELHSPTILETSKFDSHAYLSHLIDNLDEETKQSIILAGNLDPDTGKPALSSNKPGQRKEFQDRFLFAPAGKIQVSFDGDVIDGGTSSAAPYICATLANLLSKSKSITSKEAIQALLTSADKMGDRATYGQGIIRARLAYKLLKRTAR